MIDDLLKADMLEVLRANDQLKRERKLGKVFMVSNHCFPRMAIPPQPSMQAVHNHRLYTLHDSMNPLFLVRTCAIF